MYYISENSIVKSWMNLINHGKVSNKLFGLLEMIRVLDINISEKIKPRKQYTFKASALSVALQERFTFDDERSFKGNERYWVIFSENWEQTVKFDFLGNQSVSLIDIIIVCYQNFTFNTKISSKSLIDKFFEDYHLPLNAFSNFLLFDKNELDIEWRDTELPRKILRNRLLTALKIEPKNTTIGFESPFIISSNAGELSRAPFFQTLYASQGSMKCLICTKFNFFEYYKFDNSINDNNAKLNYHKFNNSNLLLKQKIYFGSPGTGKSKRLDDLVDENKLKIYRTTFHPDYDYSSFVGSFKPVTENGKILYHFVPQIFTKAYLYAWANPNEGVMLAIEEINRGNCAQIFGDLFQCLDRDSLGFSKYLIDIDSDLSKYVEDQEDAFTNIGDYQQSKGFEPDGGKIILPPNLLIYATMNTSDQSLFPMDTAFKRRWDWEFVGIDWNDANQMELVIDADTRYNWGTFIRVINEKILFVCKSEDKQLGNRFISPYDNKTISLEQFRNKVMFYLWSEIFKDEDSESPDNIFKTLVDTKEIPFSFNQLFDEYAVVTIKGFMEYNQISPIE